MNSSRGLLVIKAAEPTDVELLRLALGGDREAFTILYRRRQATIYRFTLQMTGSGSLAEDITQEVFMVLMNGGLAYDPGRGSVNSYLLGVARNHVLRSLDRDRFLVPLPEEAADETVPSTLIAKDDPLHDCSRRQALEAVRKSILSLPTRYREVVVLCDLNEVSYAEAAAILGCAVGTVRSRLHRARAMLIEKLKPVCQETAATTVTKARCFA
jgi:RNA polymerase sigma-70 factor (ECF subfamily)